MLDFIKTNRNTTYRFLIFSVFYICLIFFATTPPSSFDVFWHLQMGKDLLENGLSPWIDHYSFTYYEKEISGIPVIFQVLLAWFVSTFGESNGFYFFKVFYVTSLTFALYLYFRQIKAPWYIAFFIIPFLAYFIVLRMPLRPELISNILMVICLSLYLRARQSFSTKELLLICLLLLFWVNYHTPVLGYIIIFGLFLDKAIHKLFHNESDFSWKQWFIWGSIIFLIGFVNPTGEHFFIASISMLGSEFGKYTAEYAPSSTFYSMNKIVYLSWALSFCATVISLVKKQYGFTFITLILIYFSWSMARLVSPVAIINFSILAFLLSQTSYSEISSTLRPTIKNSLLLLLVCLPLTVSYFLVKSSLLIFENRGNEYKTLNQRYPRHVVDYLKNYHVGGNILNFMASGGYLINKLPPDYKVFIDGRTNILYPIETLKLAFPLERPKADINGKVNSDKLNYILTNYDVQYALYENTHEILLMFHGTDKLKLNFADENFLLFSKNKEIAFPISSQLTIFPMCWSENIYLGIQKEISLADTLFTDKPYLLKSVLLFLKDYLSQSDKALFLDTLNPTDLSLDLNRRLAAYISLNSRQHSTAFKYFSSISNKNKYDILMLAYSLIKNGNYSLAETTLFFYHSRNKRPEQLKESYERTAIFSHLLKIIQDHNELTKLPPSYIEYLENILKQVNYNNGDPIKTVIPYQYACKYFI